MSIEMNSPRTPLQFVDALSNLVEQMNLSFTLRDNDQFNRAYDKAHKFAAEWKPVEYEDVSDPIQGEPPLTAKPVYTQEQVDAFRAEWEKGVIEPKEEEEDEPLTKEGLEKPTIEVIAEQCHELNKTFCEDLGDVSQSSWELAPEWQKNSCIEGVKNIRDGIITAPEQSHESWMAKKEAEGWTYGKLKDIEKKEHPCMLPFRKLPREQQYKDVLFFYTVKNMIRYVNKGIETVKDPNLLPENEREKFPGFTDPRPTDPGLNPTDPGFSVEG